LTRTLRPLPSRTAALALWLLLVTAAGGLAYTVLAFVTRAITPTEVKGLLRRTGK